MNDMSSTIIAKSDQINAADLVGSPRKITIREVRIKGGEDQPVSVLVEGDNKAFRPCKGVRRLMVRVWGADANKYIGESMVLFCDPKVTWAGKEEGGIRVSHMSGIDEEIVEYMRVSRAATKPYKILPLKVEAQEDAISGWVSGFKNAIDACPDEDALNALLDGKGKRYADLESKRAELYQDCVDTINARRAAVSREGRDESQMGEHAPAWADKLASLRVRLESVTNIDAIKKVEQDWTNLVRASVDDEAEVQKFEAEIAARRKELV